MINNDLRFKLKQKRYDNHSAMFRVNDGNAGSFLNGCFIMNADLYCFIMNTE